MIDGSAFAHTGRARITVEEGNPYFRVSGDFLLGFDGTSLIRYFGSDSTVTVPRDVEILGTGCFCDHHSLCSLLFESGSNLKCVEANAFSGFSGLKSIVIPRSIQELRKDWAIHSSLRYVIFESAVSLRRMMEQHKVDLSPRFAIRFVEPDHRLQYYGHLVPTADGDEGWFRLARFR
jgi:hypothetical protein